MFVVGCDDAKGVVVVFVSTQLPLTAAWRRHCTVVDWFSWNNGVSDVRLQTLRAHRLVCRMLPLLRTAPGFAVTSRVTPMTKSS